MHTPHESTDANPLLPALGSSSASLPARPISGPHAQAEPFLKHLEQLLGRFENIDRLSATKKQLCDEIARSKHTVKLNLALNPGEYPVATGLSQEIKQIDLLVNYSAGKPAYVVRQEYRANYGHVPMRFDTAESAPPFAVRLYADDVPYDYMRLGNESNLNFPDVQSPYSDPTVLEFNALLKAAYFPFYPAEHRPNFLLPEVPCYHNPDSFVTSLVIHAYGGQKTDNRERMRTFAAALKGYFEVKGYNTTAIDLAPIHKAATEQLQTRLNEIEQRTTVALKELQAENPRDLTWSEAVFCRDYLARLMDFFADYAKLIEKRGGKPLANLDPLQTTASALPTHTPSDRLADLALYARAVSNAVREDNQEKLNKKLTAIVEEFRAFTS